jgi:hypothetical protein
MFSNEAANVKISDNLGYRSRLGCGNTILTYETMGRGPNVSFSAAPLGGFVTVPIATGILMIPAVEAPYIT